jgi:hypothetical protein
MEKFPKNISGYKTVISISGRKLSLGDPHLLGQNNSPARLCRSISIACRGFVSFEQEPKTITIL